MSVRLDASIRKSLSGKECSICLENLIPKKGSIEAREKRVIARIHSSNFHYFCENCIRAWARGNSPANRTCPMCRIPFSNETFYKPDKENRYTQVVLPPLVEHRNIPECPSTLKMLVLIVYLFM